MFVNVQHVRFKDTGLTSKTNSNSKVLAEYGKNSVTSKHNEKTFLLDWK